MGGGERRRLGGGAISGNLRWNLGTIHVTDSSIACFYIVVIEQT